MTGQDGKQKSQHEERRDENDRQLGKMAHGMSPENTFSDPAERGTESAALGRLNKDQRDQKDRDQDHQCIDDDAQYGQHS